MSHRKMETVTRKADRGKDMETVLSAELVAHGLFRLAPAEVPALRKLASASSGRKSGSQTTLRYADEQTIAATHAVLATMAKMGSAPQSFNDWGILAASRYLGRAVLASAVQVFSKEGVWGVSPHLIPHFALHSASGTISLTLGIHGPNLGIGGGPYSAAEGFLTALTWLSAGIVPGVWLVLTGWEPEFVPGGNERHSSETQCQALAMALVNTSASTESGSVGERIAVNIMTTAPGSVGIPDAPVNLWMLANLLDQPGQLGVPRIIASNPDGSYGVELSQIVGKAR